MRDHDDLSLVLPGVARAEPVNVHERRRQRRRRRGRRALTLLIALALVAGGGYGAYTALRPSVLSLLASDDYTGPGSGQVTVTIAPGDSGRAIAQVLAQAGVVKSPGAFVDAVAANPKAALIQPGTYALRRQMSAAAAVGLLLDPAARTAQQVTIREGMRVAQIVQVLSVSTGRPASDYTAALRDPAALGVPALAKGKVEGWLFPSSYQFGPDSTAVQQLSTMVAQTKKVLAQVGVPDRDAERILTIASIAEVEAASPDDFAKVARTLDNRLKIKMKLQLDSTVSYAVGKRSITTTPAERATKSAYNTYLVPGLPLGPISNPGKAAIDAAYHPAAGPWLYFVTVDPSTGETKFATTAAQHAQNVAQFQAWCRQHKGQC